MALTSGAWGAYWSRASKLWGKKRNQGTAGNGGRQVPPMRELRHTAESMKVDREALEDGRTTHQAGGRECWWSVCGAGGCPASKEDLPTGRGHANA